MKRFSKILMTFCILTCMIFSFSFADEINNESNMSSQNVESTSEKDNSNVPIEVDTLNVDTTKVEDDIEDIANKGESLAYKIIEQVSDKSLPVCALIMLWGAVLYFIMGIRNLYKKRQGLLMMWGAFTFVVIAKIVNFAFWFAFMR